MTITSPFEAQNVRVRHLVLNLAVQELAELREVPLRLLALGDLKLKNSTFASRGTSDSSLAH